jgi:lipoprotein-releasing system permease protein
MILLAIKYLYSRKRQSLLTLLGILLGAGGYVTISGFFVGFQDYLVQELINNSAHIFIQARQEFLTTHSLDRAFFKDETTYVLWASVPAGKKDYARIEKPQSWYARLQADPRVLVFSPQMNVAALFSNARASVSGALIGVLPEPQSRVNVLTRDMLEGSLMDIGSGGNRIVVGKELIRQLGAKVSQNIMVAVGTFAPTPFKVVGVFDSGNRQTDLQAFGALADIQKVNHTSNQVNEIDVKLQDFQAASRIAKTWSALSPEKIESWDERNANIFSIFNLQTMMRYIIVGVVMLVAGFGIYNVLMMMVSQKIKDIAILGALGYDSSEITLLFLVQGLALGLVGAISGVFVGYLICSFLQTLTMVGPPGSTKAPEHLHIALNLGIYLQASLFAILAALLASYLPARAAAKLTPIEIIRGGAE